MSLEKNHDQLLKMARIHQPQVKILKDSVNKYAESLTQLIEEYRAIPTRRDSRMIDYARGLQLSIAQSECRMVVMIWRRYLAFSSIESSHDILREVRT